MPVEPVSALVHAQASGRPATIIETGGWLAIDVLELGLLVDDVGIAAPEAAGFYIWVGVVDRMVGYCTSEGVDIEDVTYTGAYRRLTDTEVENLGRTRVLEQQEGTGE